MTIKLVYKFFSLIISHLKTDKITYFNQQKINDVVPVVINAAIFAFVVKNRLYNTQNIQLDQDRFSGQRRKVYEEAKEEIERLGNNIKNQREAHKIDILSFSNRIVYLLQLN